MPKAHGGVPVPEFPDFPEFPLANAHREISWAAQCDVLGDKWQQGVRKAEKGYFGDVTPSKR